MRANQRLCCVVVVTWGILLIGWAEATAADKLSKEALLVLGKPAPQSPGSANPESGPSRALPTAPQKSSPMAAQNPSASAEAVAMPVAAVPVATKSIDSPVDLTQTEAGPLPTEASIGRKLFLRKWVENDPRAHGGDGLGPAYNDISCVACHDQGGIGGGGDNRHNVDVLTARVIPGRNFDEPSRDMALTDVHRGFRDSNEFVLHKFGTDPKYAEFHKQLLQPQQEEARFAPQGNSRGRGGVFAKAPNLATDPLLRASMLQVGIRDVTGPETLRTAGGIFSVVHSVRNATALFGVGLIDSIPDEVLLQEEERQHRQDPSRAGRVARLPGGKLGRFGWKSQAATLDEFTSTACAMELGLTVPGRSQATLPTDYSPFSPKLDMTGAEVSALATFLRGLPRPVQGIGVTAEEADYLALGRAQFAMAGCTFCHTSKLGNIDGMYSDLLLHDITPELSRSYYGRESSPGDSPIDLADIGKAKALQEIFTKNWTDRPGNALLPKEGEPEKHHGSLGPEWRTPPLWGVRDSGPYMHDGHAATLEQAIVLHGGQAQQSALAFFKLKPTEQKQLIAFLKSLAAPEVTTELAAR